MLISRRYDRIVNRMKSKLSERNWNKTRQLLGWIVSAKRPLKMHELQAVLSIEWKKGEPIELTGKTMNYKNTLRVHITECCGSLVHMVGEDQVELVHHTARESVDYNFTSPLRVTKY